MTYDRLLFLDVDDLGGVSK